MPIKFRCEKCRQFLGISRSLAGQVVDCPTCGRATRVPNLDGSRKPIPQKPKLDRADSSLLNALDQLAELSKPPAAEQSNGSANKVPDGPGAKATVASDPGPAEPLQPVAVVDPPPGPGPDDSGRHPVPLKDPTEPLDSAAVLQSLADSAGPMDPIPVADGPNRLVQAAVVLGVAVVCAIGGFFAGRSGKPAPQPVDEPVTGPVVAEKGPAKPVAGFAGRITYRQAGTECLPDTGARVIAWPEGVAPDAPWKMDGFRSGDAKSLVNTASKQLTQLGGAMAVVGKDGTFELPLPSGGEFNIFVVSRFGGKAQDAEPPSASDLARLRMCFAEPQRLIGKTQFALVKVTYRGKGQQILDHVFEVEE